MANYSGPTRASEPGFDITKHSNTTKLTPDSTQALKEGSFHGGNVYYSATLPKDHKGAKVEYFEADQDIFNNALNNWDNINAMEPAILRLHAMGYLDNDDIYSKGNNLKKNLESAKIRGAMKRWEINTNKARNWNSMKRVWDSIMDKIPGLED